MTRDLTVGKPLKTIVLFTLPIFVGNVFQQLYSMIDAIIVGHTISNDALAGVGATGAISFLVIGFVQGLTAGFAVKTSQLFGAKDEDGVRRSIASSLLLCAALSVALTAVAVLTTMPLLKLMNTHPDIIGYSYDYIVTVYWGLTATVFYNMASSVMRAIGDSRTPLIFLIAAAVLNVAFDFLFIVAFKMGVAGAGWATTLSQALSAIGCFIYLFAKFKKCRIKREHFKNPFKFYRKHLAIGLPMALQFSITAVGVMVQQTALNGLGKSAVTAYTAASKIDNLAAQPLYALGSAVATYCGQNYGAGNIERIRKGVRVSMLAGVVCSLAGLAFVTLPAAPLTKLFISDITDELLALSKQFLLYQGVFYVALAAIFVYRNALQGIGRSTLVVFAGVTELVMRIIASVVLVSSFGYLGICLSNPAAWVGADVFLIVSYVIIIGKLKKKFDIHDAALSRDAAAIASGDDCAAGGSLPEAAYATAINVSDGYAAVCEESGESVAAATVDCDAQSSVSSDVEGITYCAAALSDGAAIDNVAPSEEAQSSESCCK